MTAVSGSVYTAAQFNTFVRDNLNETAPAKATTAVEMRIFKANITSKPLKYSELHFYTYNRNSPAIAIHSGS